MSNAQRPGLGASDRFVSTPSVLHYAGKLDDFGDPAPVFLCFCFGLNCESHLPSCRRGASAAQSGGVPDGEVVLAADVPSARQPDRPVREV